MMLGVQEVSFHLTLPFHLTRFGFLQKCSMGIICDLLWEKGPFVSKKIFLHFLHRTVAERLADTMPQLVCLLRVWFQSYTQTCFDSQDLPEQRYCGSKINFQFTHEVSVYVYKAARVRF